MKINSKDLKYLKGEKFDVDYKMKLVCDETYDRITTLINLTKNKKVLHIGCCDHINVIDEKVQNGTWLHKMLNENCKEVIGIDINKDAINYIISKKYADNVIYNNILTDKCVKFEGIYDYMLLGEILEHVDNPVDFLATIHDKYQGKVKKIIISVPNALKFCAMSNMKSENINSDHKYYFTPYTLCKILNDAGFEPTNIEFADAYVSKKIFNIKLTKKIKGYYGMTLISIAKF